MPRLCSPQSPGARGRRRLRRRAAPSVLNHGLCEENVEPAAAVASQPLRTVCRWLAAKDARCLGIAIVRYYTVWSCATWAL